MSTETKEATATPMEQVAAIVVEEIQKWVNTNSKEVIAKQVKDRLDKHQKEIMLKLMGFDNGWGDGWKLDHCNGRAGESIAGDWLRSIQVEAIKSWMHDVGMPELTEAEKKSIKSSMKSTYIEYIKRNMHSTVISKANDELNAMIAEAIPNDPATMYMEALALLDPSVKKKGK